MARAAALCRLRVDTRAPARARSFTDARLATWRCERDVADAVRIVVSELVTNAVLHSGATGISVHLDCTAAQVLVRVWDNGIWREPAAAHPDDLAEGGRGLTLVTAHAVDRGIRQTAAGTCAWALMER